MQNSKDVNKKIPVNVPAENISPKEIESVINQLKEVTASSVVGIKDDKWGEKVVAAIVLKQKNTVSTKEILDHCKTHLHPWKCPKEIVFIDELPKNTMGKILTDEVRRLF
jgi:malonyl-CoA/methylmalonyl-CoA synthetase